MLPSINWPVTLVAAAVALGAGAMAATWRADAQCANRVDALRVTISNLQDDKRELELGIAEQNSGVAVAKAQTDAAKAAQAQAEQHAADLAQFSQSRLDKLANAVTKASTCGEVLKGYWEMRK